MHSACTVFAVEESDGIYLYEAAVQAPVMKRLSNKRLNATGGVDILWLDNDSFLTLMIPENYPVTPAKPRVPSGSIIQESTGKAMPARTYQDLLTDAYDEQLFEYYFTSQIVKVSGGVVTSVGKPAVYSNISLSPDKSLLLISEIKHPYSYQVPMYSFPRKYYVMDIAGRNSKKWRVQQNTYSFWIPGRDAYILGGFGGL